LIEDRQHPVLPHPSQRDAGSTLNRYPEAKFGLLHNYPKRRVPEENSPIRYEDAVVMTGTDVENFTECIISSAQALASCGGHAGPRISRM